jgi:hypothetical protein
VAISGPGCFKEGCKYHHIDLANPRYIWDNLHRNFLPDFRIFLDKPEVSQYFKATDAFRTFLG